MVERLWKLHLRKGALLFEGGFWLGWRLLRGSQDEELEMEGMLTLGTESTVRDAKSTLCLMQLKQLSFGKHAWSK